MSKRPCPSNNNDVVFVDLSEEDEEEDYEEEGYEEYKRNRLVGNVRTASKPAAQSCTKKIKLEGSSTTKIASSATSTIAPTISATPSQLGEEDVEIVEPVIPKLAVTPSASEKRRMCNIYSDVDDDVIVEGVLNETRLPHLRQHCTNFPFQMGSFRSSCDMCYCYICDCPVKDCKEWWPSSLGVGVEVGPHCMAHDKDRTYQKMRSSNVRRRHAETEATTVTSTSTPTNNSSSTTTHGNYSSSTTSTTLTSTVPPSDQHHPRMLCPVHRFDPKPTNKLNYFDFRVMVCNKKSCPSCYCYECMCPVSDCKKWFAGGYRKAEANHCCSQ